MRKTFIIDLNEDGEADLKISLDEEPIEDIISFDINDPKKLHVQDIQNVDYDGGVTADNTTLSINDPSAMTTSSTGLIVSWDSAAGTWAFTPTAEYLSPPVSVSGDATYCSIDLDGSGNDNDEDDIVFTFGEALTQDSFDHF